MTRWYCPDCDRTIAPVNGVTAIFSWPLNAWYCAHCASIQWIDGNARVIPDSKGELEAQWIEVPA